MENQEIIKLNETPQSLNYLNKEGFDHIQRVAMVFSKSDMVPKRYQNNPGNCIIALEIAARIGASALLVMQNLDVIQGKPGWSSTFLIASINSCGKFSPLRYEENDKDGGSCRAWAYDLSDREKIHGAWVTMKMAEAEGWTTKAGSKWKTMPGLMIRYRAAAFFSRQFAPEVSMGMQTIEELIDVAPPPKIAIEDLQVLLDSKREMAKQEDIEDMERCIAGKEEKSYKKFYDYWNSL